MKQRSECPLITCTVPQIFSQSVSSRSANGLSGVRASVLSALKNKLCTDWIDVSIVGGSTLAASNASNSALHLERQMSVVPQMRK